LSLEIIPYISYHTKKDIKQISELFVLLLSLIIKLADA